MNKTIIFLFSFSIFFLMAFESLDNTHKNFALISQIKSLETRIVKLEKIINETSRVTVTRTHYNFIEAQTDSTPGETGCLNRVRIGRIAVSQDLFFKGWTCGKWVSIKGLGIVQIDDVMNYKKERQIDVGTATIKEANRLGIIYNVRAVLLTNYKDLKW